MEEFLGLIVFGATALAFALFAPFFRRQPKDGRVDSWALPELFAVALVLGFAISVSLIGSQLIAAWQSHLTPTILIADATAAIGVIVITPLAVRLARARERGRGKAAA